jgi:hypothetical protein
MSYRRFDRSAEAIRFAIEQLPPLMQRGTVMEIGDVRFEFTDIRKLYDSVEYPFPRDVADSEGARLPARGDMTCAFTKPKP